MQYMHTSQISTAHHVELHAIKTFTFIAQFLLRRPYHPVYGFH